MLITENKNNIEAKNKLLNNAKNIFKGREKIIEGLKNKIFPLNYYDDGEQRSRYKIEENNIRDNNSLIDCKKLNRLFNLKAKDINNELVRRYFQA